MKTLLILPLICAIDALGQGAPSVAPAPAPEIPTSSGFVEAEPPESGTATVVVSSDVAFTPAPAERSHKPPPPTAATEPRAARDNAASDSGGVRFDGGYGADGSGGRSGYGGGRVIVQSASSARGDGEGTLGRGLFQEEQGELDSAAEAYRSLIADFDKRRADTAQAVFRLAEVYRKQGKLEEAKVLYARILREFNDQNELARLSQRLLFGEFDRAATSGSTMTRVENVVTQAPRMTGADHILRPLPPPAEAPSAPNRRSRNGIEAYWGRLEQDRATAAPSRTFRSGVEGTGPAEAPVGTATPSSDAPGVASTYSPFLMGPLERELHSIDASVVAPIDPDTERRLRNLDSKKAEVEHELGVINTALMEAQNLALDAELSVRAAKGVDPIRLPPPANDDPRYQALKQSYENAILADPAESATVDKLSAKIQKWVDKIYLPELLERESMADERVAWLRFQKAELEAQLSDLREERTQVQVLTRARQEASQRPAVKISIVNNLRQIDGATEQWALENRKTQGAAVTREDIAPYIRGGFPTSIAGEEYILQSVGKAPIARFPTGTAEWPAGTVMTVNGVVQKPEARP